MAMHGVVQPNFDWYEQRRGLFLFAFGRLKPGVTLDAGVSASCEPCSPVWSRRFPSTTKDEARARCRCSMRA